MFGQVQIQVLSGGLHQGSFPDSEAQIPPAAIFPVYMYTVHNTDLNIHKSAYKSMWPHRRKMEGVQWN